MTDLRRFIERMPKAELHVHVEGTLEPELKFDLARRNGIELPHRSVEEMRSTPSSIASATTSTICRRSSKSTTRA